MVVILPRKKVMVIKEYEHHIYGASNLNDDIISWYKSLSDKHKGYIGSILKECSTQDFYDPASDMEIYLHNILSRNPNDYTLLKAKDVKPEHVVMFHGKEMLLAELEDVIIFTVPHFCKAKINEITRELSLHYRPKSGDELVVVKCKL